MKFYNFLLWVFILWNCYIIVYYKLLLSIVNVDRCDNFILLSLHNTFILCDFIIYIFIIIFIKNILN